MEGLVEGLCRQCCNPLAHYRMRSPPKLSARLSHFLGCGKEGKLLHNLLPGPFTSPSAYTRSSYSFQSTFILVSTLSPPSFFSLYQPTHPPHGRNNYRTCAEFTPDKSLTPPQLFTFILLCKTLPPALALYHLRQIQVTTGLWARKMHCKTFILCSPLSPSSASSIKPPPTPVESLSIVS